MPLISLSSTEKKERLIRLRALLQEKDLSGFFVPHEDEYQNEMIAPYAERLAWLTGFSGSAGLAIVLKEKAVLFIDGRYTTQAQAEVDPHLFSCERLHPAHIQRWLSDSVVPGSTLGYDPCLHTFQWFKEIEAVLLGHGSRMSSVPNLIDLIWTDQPSRPSSSLWSYPLNFAGEDVSSKVSRVQKILEAKKRVGYLITDPQSMAWLFNIRASDIECTPIPLAYAFVPVSGQSVLFIDSARVPESVKAAFPSSVRLMHPDAIHQALEAHSIESQNILLHKATASMYWHSELKDLGANIVYDHDPIALLKAVKNSSELEGIRQAHEEDGRAIIRFLYWFSQHAYTRTVTENDVVEILATFRQKSTRFLESSFPTIAAAGPHASMPHYRPTLESNAKIEDGIFLIDSGGQYTCGTTDITRTLVVGEPNDEMRDRFTRVLKGHIALATAVFPSGTTGTHLDALARYSLWRLGLDYDHGTGHGVGACLSVHEGPQRISRNAPTVFEDGMILSNEPGYYKSGHWGIRLENLLAVRAHTPPDSCARKEQWFDFEMLSFVPFERYLIAQELLSEEERMWINSYHQRVWDLHAHHLETDVRNWLKIAIQPL